MRFIVFATLGILAAQPQTLDDLQRTFRTPPDDAKIMMRWWWFGPSLSKADIDRDLTRMKEGGIGGVEVQPVYPLALDDPSAGFRNYAWLSDEFIEMLRYARGKAAELNLKFDLTLGSGWPFGGPHIPVTQAAGRLRVDRISVPARATHIKAPALSNGEKLIGYFVNNRQIPNLDAALHKGEPQTVLAFISSRTGMMVKRPSVAAEGFVLDHYDRAALDNHLRTAGDRLMKAFGRTPPRAVFSDSLEVFASDWTPELLSEFQKRRGYDLTPHLPALVSDTGPDTGAIRNDWARTLTELCNERYLAPLNAWARKNGTLFRSQTYGVPPVTLASQALVDLPEGEKPHWRSFSATRWATSAGHLFKKPVVSTETWTWLHSPSFRATPLDMKAEADLHFLQGVTQLIGHGWPSSPEAAGEPGWRFYAAAVFNHHNPWWIVMPDVAAYLQRATWILRQGEAANDVALYLPTADARARFTVGNASIDRTMETLLPHDLIPQILDSGYNFDFIDDETIEQLVVPHRILVLPNVERMSAAAARRIADYRAKGGIVIATDRLPSKAPGLKDAAPQLEAPVTPLKDLGAALKKALAPDLKAAPGIGFIHRKLSGADVYFVANTTNRPITTAVELRVKGPVHALDPYSGEATANTGTFAPYESRVLVVAAGTPLTAPASTASDITLSLSGGPWPEYFSGVRSYEAKFTRPAARRIVLDFGEGTPVEGSQGNKPGMRAWLDSPVREAAVVWVNGKKAGSIWRPPYELDITSHLIAGENAVKLDVANTAINQLAGESLPNYRLLNIRYGERFQPQDMDNLKAIPSGLQKPVRLRLQN